MKQRYKKVKLLAMIVAIVMLISTPLGVSATGKVDSFEKLVAAQKRAVAANEKLMQYFWGNGWATEYPEFFGGCYIEENILNVRLVNPSAQTMDALSSVFAGYEDVVTYVFGKNSQASLQLHADETAAELKEFGYGVTHWYVDSFTEEIIIGVLEKDVDAVSCLIQGKRTDSRGNERPEIIIEKSEYVTTDTQVIYGGTRLRMPTDNRTAGACGYYAGGNALVTCGHGNTTVGSTVRFNDEIIGTVAYVQYTDGEQGDFSIISLTNAQLSHKISKSDQEQVTITNGTLLSPAVGTYIYRYGDESGVTQGIVDATNITTTSTQTNTSIRGLTRATLTTVSGSSPGDSGGPYLAGGAFCGIHSGCLPTNTKVVFFTPYSLIYNAGFNVIGSHSCTRWTDAGADSHSGYCAICQAIVYESHGEYYNHQAGRCTRCGRIGNIVV